MSLDVTVSPSVDDLPRRAWDRLAPRDVVLLESDHLAAIEHSGINDVRPYYLVATEGDRAVGIAVCFRIELDLSAVGGAFAPHVREAMGSWHPGFLRRTVLQGGLVSALGEPVAATPEAQERVIPAVLAEMRRIGLEVGVDILLIRDIPFPRHTHYLAGAREPRMCPVMGFPRATMALRWDGFDGYVASLKAHSRRKLRRVRRGLEAPGITTAILPDYGDRADELARLWRAVHDRAGTYAHEDLTAAYFREMSEHLPGRSEVVAISYEGELAAFCLCLVGDRQVAALHCGLDYRLARRFALYPNLHHLALERAIERGAAEVDFGITTYDFKASTGCQLRPTVYLVQHLRDEALTPALASLLTEAIEQPENRHRPFRDEGAGDHPRLAALRHQLSRDRRRGRDVLDHARSHVRAARLRLTGLYDGFPAFEGAQQPIVAFRGRPVIMLGANAYLGLSTHPALRRAARDAIDHYGTGCTGSPPLSGTTDLHTRLCAALASFVGKQDALLFTTGYQANLGVVSAIVGSADVAVIEADSHASIVDGARLSGATVVRFRAGEPDSLVGALQRHPDRPALIVLDSVFSMFGTVADLPAVVEIARAHGARILLDEAHGIGVLGPGGRGVAEHFGLSGEIDLIMGTFSKSFSATGGFVAGDRDVVDYLRHTARSHIFSASPAPAVVATVTRALELIQGEEAWRRARVLESACWLSGQLRELGYDAPYGGTPIVPVYCRDELLVLGLYRRLLDDGLYVNPVPHPAVPRGRELLRTSCMATHDRSTLEAAVECFARRRTRSFPRLPATAEELR